MQYHHIFFHSLVVYPELAFHKEPDSKRNFELWMVTVEEYKKTLLSLYRKNYILVKMSDLLLGNLDIPEGKIPLVLSFDDVNYYDYMKGYGFADRMVLDENGNIANRLITPKGETIVSREADGAGILEQFIEEHPDFSYGNARGILAVTGYEGILGYREYAESEELLKVIAALKEKGWEFACHSFYHKDAVFKAEPAKEALCIEDTRMWLKEIGPIVGETPIYISPFGIDVRKMERFHKFLKQAGFRFFCDVNNLRQFTCQDSCYYFPRINVDGFLFQYRNYEFEYYYGCLDEILDRRRLKEYTLYGRDGKSLAMHGIVCSKMPTAYVPEGLGSLNEKGERCFDSAGLICNYLMGGLTHFHYEKTLHKTDRELFLSASVLGTMETLPEKRGVCLYMSDHVGIYLCNGTAIEVLPDTKSGNCIKRTEVDQRPWTHWFFCPGIEMD